MAWGGATPPQEFTPQWGGAVGLEGGVGGSTCFQQISEIQDAPPHSGGEHLIISEGKQLVISGFTPQWGGAFGLRGGVGGSISQIFGISFSEKFTPQWGGVWGGVFGAEGGEGGERFTPWGIGLRTPLP